MVRGQNSKFCFLEILSKCMSDPYQVSSISAQQSRSLRVLKVLTPYEQTDAQPDISLVFLNSHLGRND